MEVLCTKIEHNYGGCDRSLNNSLAAWRDEHGGGYPSLLALGNKNKGGIHSRALLCFFFLHVFLNWFHGPRHQEGDYSLLGR